MSGNVQLSNDDLLIINGGEVLHWVGYILGYCTGVVVKIALSDPIYPPVKMDSNTVWGNVVNYDTSVPTVTIKK
jgi:hypothetical protein